MPAVENVVAVFENSLNDSVRVTLLDASGARPSKSLELPGSVPPKALGDKSTSAILSEIARCHAPMGLRAFVFVDTDPAGADQAPRLVRSEPTPLWHVPSWVAVASASLGNTEDQCVVIDTTAPGLCRLLHRRVEGNLDIHSASFMALTGLLRRDAASVDGHGDVILGCILADPEFSSIIGGAAPDGTNLRDFLEAQALTRPQLVSAAMSRTLEPLADILSSAHKLTDCSRIICSGELGTSQVLTSLFAEAIEQSLVARHSNFHPRITWITSLAARHLGALKSISSELSRPGVWVSHNGPHSLRLTLAAPPREIRYEVVHPQQYVFDTKETSLVDFLGNRPVMMVVDARVEELYGDDIRAYEVQHLKNIAMHISIDGAEAKKTWDQVRTICDAAISCDLRRDGVMVAVGGGVVLDVVGFAASIYRRGVPYLRVPTTLIGLVDVGVGVKQGINVAKKKNILGSFYPALGSINDSSFLRTLDATAISGGLAEIIKMAIIRDKVLFELLEVHGPTLLASRFQAPPSVSREVIARAEESMMAELQKNLFEADLRRLVDFGHSFSPRIEADSDYSIPHGQAVALDMLICAYLAVERRLCPREVLDRMIRLYRSVNLPISQVVCDAETLFGTLDGIRSHRGGDLNLVVPKGLGSADFIQEVEYADVHYALEILALENVRGSQASNSS